MTAPFDFAPLLERELLTGTPKPRWQLPWDMASPHSFRATVP